MRVRSVVAAFVILVGVAAFVWATTYTTSDPAVAIPDNSGGTITACQTINVPDSVTITDVDVVVTMNHTWAGDVTLVLSPPAGTSLTLLNRPGRTGGTGFGNSDDLVDAAPVTYDDEAASATLAEDMGDGCVGIIGQTAGCPDNYIPSPDPPETPIAGLGTDLAQFDGGSSLGVWTLCAADSAGGDTGALTSWTISFTPDIPVELQSFSVE